MKSSIIHLLSLFLILSFTASCGKKESSRKGEDLQNSAFNTLNATGSVARANLEAWYNSTVEGSYPNLNNGMPPLREVTRQTRNISSTSCKENAIICFNFNWSIGSYTQVKEYVTLIPSGDKKSGNAALAKAFAPLLSPGVDGLYLKDITQEPSKVTSGSSFVITYVTSGNPSKTVVQIIDSGYNSRLNPVYTYDGVNLKEIRFSSLYPNN